MLVGFILGPFIDLGMFIFNFVHPTIYVGKIIVLLLGCIVLALGLYFQVKANVIINPAEGLVWTIANKRGKKFGTIKIIFDVTLVLLGLVISLFAFEAVKGIREGTIMSAFLVGYIIQIFNTFLHRFEHEERLAS